MFFTFAIFRKILLAVILLLDLVSLTLAVYLKASFTHSESTYVMVGILDGVIFATILSIFRAAIFHSAQSVATETLGLFALLPFHLILTLFVLGVTVIPGNPTALWIFAVLQILIIIATIIHGLYTIGLMFTAMLTVCVFDRDVWCRDIDSSPSPFPMTFLLGTLFPCFSTTGPFPTETTDSNPDLICIPGSVCNCSTKASISGTSEGAVEMARGLEPAMSMRMLAGASSTRSLVRLPNDIERRSSIHVAFEV
ncbi:hypothetical protein C8J57DRAFT_1495780 [Mycena rebaudengoi]|nr:hypothetical protein C8J57DRAFT_1495780 [Mycena rebaudengoi]